MTGTTFIMFFKIVFHRVQLRIPLIPSLRNIYLRHAVFNIHYVIHLILKNGINNIFPSQTSFLLLSSVTHASFANKPIKFCCRKPNTWQHIFAVIIFIYGSIFFAVGLISKFRGLTRVLHTNPNIDNNGICHRKKRPMNFVLISHKYSQRNTNLGITFCHRCENLFSLQSEG